MYPQPQVTWTPRFVNPCHCDTEVGDIRGMGLGGSSALVKLERGSRTHLPRSSQSGDPGLPHYQESQAAKESQVGTHNTVGARALVWERVCGIHWVRGRELTCRRWSPRSSRAVNLADHPVSRASFSRGCQARRSRASLSSAAGCSRLRQRLGVGAS